MIGGNQLEMMQIQHFETLVVLLRIHEAIEYLVIVLAAYLGLNLIRFALYEVRSWKVRRSLKKASKKKRR